MNLSIIIVNFNTFQLTCDCIRSIQKHLDGIAYEVILVDNAPKDDYSERFKEIFPCIVYVRSEQNIGFGRANNLGIEKAGGKYLLLINSDTLVIDNSLLACYFFMESNASKSVGLLGCKLLNYDGSYQPSFFPFTKNSLANYLIGNNLLLYKLFNVSDKYKSTDQVREVGDVSGAFMFMRREVVEKAGAFDPDFFLYCEETEWCRERIAKQFKIVYYPHAKIIHLGGKSAPKDLMFIQSKLSHALLWYKKGWVNYISYILIFYLNAFANLLMLPFVSSEARGAVKRDWQCSYKIFPYLFTDVPKYRPTWGSRKKPLIYNKARSFFFNN